jgi:hypothetical protein
MPGPGNGSRRYPGDIMKKRVKKLVLSRETLRALDEHQIQEAVGASGGGLPGSHCLQCNSFYICNPQRTVEETCS